MDVLVNQVRCYAWGSTTAIPRLLGTPPDGEPQAELWIGAHERAPSSVVRGGQLRTLDEVVAADPGTELGPELAEAAPAGAGRLPFLAKILAVERPLSLQLHPRADHAERGHAQERSAGVARDAAERCYPDACAKPELLYAMSDFSALCGLRPVEESAALLAEVALPELLPLRRALERGGQRAVGHVLGALLRLPPAAAAPMVSRLRKSGAVPPGTATLAEGFPEDPAVLASLLLRPVTLSAGETLYVAPAQLHCYLSGLACEVQGNSDNVVRAGLTHKHVDVDQVLELADLSADPTTRTEPTRRGVETVYDPGVGYFAVGVVRNAPQRAHLSDVPGPALLLCLAGRYEVDDGAPGVLEAGQAAYLSAGSRPVHVRGSGTLLRVTAGRAGWDARPPGSEGAR